MKIQPEPKEYVVVAANADKPRAAIKNDSPPGKYIIKAKSGKVLKVLSVTPREAITEQAHAKECDMNYILRNYQKTGLLKHVRENEGRYDDVSVEDFQSAMFIVNEAQQMFEKLPADVRQKFGHSPVNFLEFVQNPANRKELKSMGMLKGNDGLNASGEAVQTPTEENPPKATA